MAFTRHSPSFTPLSLRASSTWGVMFTSRRRFHGGLESPGACCVRWGRYAAWIRIRSTTWGVMSPRSPKAVTPRFFRRLATTEATSGFTL